MLKAVMKAFKEQNRIPLARGIADEGKIPMDTLNLYAFLSSPLWISSINLFSISTAVT